MPKFQIGVAFRGTALPEIMQVVEASSIRQAMLGVARSYGGDDVVLVTFAHPVADWPPPGAGGAEAGDAPRARA
ncbi:MAG TPA: hypothetical protein VN106_01170 [Sphingomicrobium sp.]|nr:hypothetical protein [Sphingomicrobium sp.]